MNFYCNQGSFISCKYQQLKVTSWSLLMCVLIVKWRSLHRRIACFIQTYFVATEPLVNLQTKSNYFFPDKMILTLKFLLLKIDACTNHLLAYRSCTPTQALALCLQWQQWETCLAAPDFVYPMHFTCYSLQWCCLVLKDVVVQRHSLQESHDGSSTCDIPVILGITYCAVIILYLIYFYGCFSLK